MELDAKIDLLMSLAVDDQDGTPNVSGDLPPRLRNAKAAGALRPLNIRSVRIGANGPKAQLLRILMTNACSFNCHYCPMRRDRTLPRTLLKPAEIVRVFLDAFTRGWCSGLFLSTAIPGRPTKVMDDLIEVLELLRVKYKFAGYIHVKIVPGADDAQIERITALATRVSLNLETPCGETLAPIAPDKSFDTSIITLQRARKRVVDTQMEERDGKRRDVLLPGGAAGMTMQFVVGATSDSDQTLLNKTSELYRDGGIHHAQFSAFRPIRDTPMENVKATPALREHRLYQADHLMRRYRYGGDEIVFGNDGNLPLANDPKVTWALAHPERFPMELKTASYSELLRVPGIGPIVARKIVSLRRSTFIRGLSDLRKLGAAADRAAGFLTIGGRLLRSDRWREQLGLWRPEEEVGVPSHVYEFSPGTFR